MLKPRSNCRRSGNGPPDRQIIALKVRSNRAKSKASSSAMSGIFIRGGVCNEACTGRVCHQRVRFLLAAARNLQNRSVVPGRLPSIFVSHTVISGSGRTRGGRRKPNVPCLAAATWPGALRRTFRVFSACPLLHLLIDRPFWSTLPRWTVMNSQCGRAAYPCPDGATV